MTSSRPTRNHRLIEVLAVVLLGIATIGSAWCGYQATRWNGEEDDLARDASNLQVEAARQFGLATQYVSYDSTMIAQYAQAVSDGNDKLREFYRETLFRPEFLPVLAQWEAEVAAGRNPTNLLTDEGYLEAQLAPYRDATERSAAASESAQEAGDHADEYVLTTLLLASALFFAGLTTSFRLRLPQLMLLVGAGVLIAYAAARLVDLPTI